MLVFSNLRDPGACVVFSLLALEDDQLAFTIRSLGLGPNFYLVGLNQVELVKQLVSKLGQQQIIVDPMFFNQSALYVSEQTKAIVNSGIPYMVLNVQCLERVRQAVFENHGDCGLIASLPFNWKSKKTDKLDWAWAVLCSELEQLSQVPKSSFTRAIMSFWPKKDLGSDQVQSALLAGASGVVISNVLGDRNTSPYKMFLTATRTIERSVISAVRPG